MLTGGRNIADGYFGMSEHMNYLDRDIWIKGPIALSAVHGFNLFWNDPVVENPQPPEEPAFRRRTHPASSKTFAKTDPRIIEDLDSRRA